MATSSVRFGVGATREIGMDLADQGVRRAMVVTDANLARLSPVATVLDSLAGEGIEFSLFDRVRVEPTDVSMLEAIAFARSYGGGLSVLSVVDVPSELYAEAPKAGEDLVRKAKEYTAAVRKQAEAAGVPVDTYVGEAEADEAIVTLAAEQNADMIVVGSHGRTGLRRLLMGSVTEKVIGRSSCPVLVVRS